MRILPIALLPGILGAQAPGPAQNLGGPEGAKPVVAPDKSAVPPEKPRLLPPAKEGDLPCDSKDQQAVLVGATTRKAILAHRELYRTNTDKAAVPADLLKRWSDLSTPCVLVVALGSWCGDTQRELPDFLALAAQDNPFVKVHYIGVYRDKKTESKDWPQGVEPQVVAKVPTFWLYVQQPGGGYKLTDSIVENPPKKGQRMAEAVLEMLEKAR